MGSVRLVLQVVALTEMKVCLILLVCLIGMALAMPAPDADADPALSFTISLGGGHGNGGHNNGGHGHGGHGGHRPNRPYWPQPVYSSGHNHHFNTPGVFTGYGVQYGQGHGHGHRGPQ